MGTRLNLYCNGSFRKEPRKKFTKNFDRITFQGGPRRDKFGILVKGDGTEEGCDARSRTQSH